MRSKREREGVRDNGNEGEREDNERKEQHSASLMTCEICSAEAAQMGLRLMHAQGKHKESTQVAVVQARQSLLSTQVCTQKTTITLIRIGSQHNKIY